MKSETEEFEWGVVVNFEKRDERSKNPAKEGSQLFVHTLLYVRTEEGSDEPRPCSLGSPGEIEVVPVKHNQICQLSSLRVHVPDDLTSPDKKKSVLKTIEVSTLYSYSS